MRLYVAMGWAGGGWEVSGSEAEGLTYRRRGHDGAVLEERRIRPPAGAWRAFERRLGEIGIRGWEPRYEPEYPVCGGTTWAVRLGDRKSTGEDAYPPNWAAFLDALSAMVGFRLE